MDGLVLKGKIKRMFKNCPKPNGWFGCFFKPNYKEDITLIGVTNIPLQDGMTLQVTCHSEVKNGREQYVADDIQVITLTRKATIMYLSGPSFPGIGQVTAETLWSEFGEDVLDVIKQEPNKLKTIGLSDDKIHVLCRGVNNHDVNNQLRQLMPWITNKLLNRIICEYNETAVTVIKGNPYVLYFKFSVSLSKVDDVAAAIGLTPDSEHRIHAYIDNVFCELTSCGHVFLNLSDDDICGSLIYNVINKMQCSTVTIQKVMGEISCVPTLSVKAYKGNSYLYKKQLLYAENVCVNVLSELMMSNSLVTATDSEINQYIDKYEFCNNERLDIYQRDAVLNAMNNRISIVTGGPGRGKTTVIKCILYVWEQVTMNSKQPILSAPTGRAAKRLSDAVGEKYINCRTIASRILEDKVLKSNILIVDEASMICLKDAGAFLSLVTSCQIVFVGDVNQLPSIDEGSFFKDICEIEGIAKTVLQICYRSDSRYIIDNADKIKDGMLANQLSYDVDTFMFYPQIYDDDGYVDDIINSYKQYLHDGVDFNEICILCPMKSGSTGVHNLNIKLQNELNPETIYNGVCVNNVMHYDMRGYSIPDTYYKGINGCYTRFRVGDKVMQTVNRYDANGYNKVNKSWSAGIFNGDCGVIKEYCVPDDVFMSPYLVVEMDGSRVYKINAEYFDELDLSYAMSIHKSQGSEYNVVLLSIQCKLATLPANFDFASRNLFYTGVTRAKKSVGIFGSVDSINRCIQTQLCPRNSVLTDRVNEIIASINIMM